MEQIHLYFYRSIFKWWNPLNLSAGLMRVVTNSKHNHVAIGIDDKIYQVIAFKGAIKTSYHREAPCDVIKINLRPTPQNINRIKEVVNYLESNLGKGYDYLSSYGFLSATRTQSKNRLFCSELVNKSLDILFGTKTGLVTLHSPKDVYIRAKSYLQGFQNGKDYAEQEK